MAASAEAPVLEKSTNPTDNWTVVLPRRGKQRRSLPKIKTNPPGPEKQSWAPVDCETDLDRESRLMQKVHILIRLVERSVFLQTIVDQVTSAKFSESIFRVLGSESKMQMVIYGIGSIESYATPRLQLSLALLLKRKCDWIGDIELFDPVLSATETRVLEALGCSVLSVNEQGRRRALKPTFFFMPHCEAELYNNLLHENWGVELLKRMVLFGNSFKTYEEHVSVFKESSVADKGAKILSARRFTDEFEVKTDEVEKLTCTADFFSAFHDSSWHFFRPEPESLTSLKD